MAIDGLTQQQTDFIERFLKVPKVFNRKAKKRERQEATEQFRLFNAEHDLLRDEIATIDDPEVRNVMLAQLRAAEGVIESNPKALNFEGGHAQLDDVRNAVLVHVKKADADRAYAQLQTAMSRHNAGNPSVAQDGASDAQSDIALTWAFIEEKLASGKGSNNPKDLDAALKAMGRLQIMMRDAAKVGQNPFEARLAEVGNARADALEGLDPKVLDARRRLSDTYNQLAALREKLAAQFGADGVPLALSMGCQTTKIKLDEAADASVQDIVGLADDAESSFAAINRDAIKLIAESQEWAKDHAAFLIRYEVMQTHSRRNSRYVKPKFEEITTAYSAAKEEAAKHEYFQACSAINVVRNNLKDALDFADDYANYRRLFGERETLLATLPDPANYPLPKLAQDHADALDLLQQAKSARQAGQMSGALTLLNRIPAAVQDIVDLNKFASSFVQYERDWKHWRNKLAADFEPPVLALLSTGMAYSARIGQEARDDARAGDFKKASGRMLALRSFAYELVQKAKYITGYLEAKVAFTARRRATRARKGPEGRVAIENYYQGLVGNEAKRVAAEATGDFKLAKAMCLRLLDQHDEMMRLADDAKDYLKEEATFKATLAKLKTATSPDAMEAKRNAEEMKANAFAATERGNWLAGANLLQNANLEVTRAVNDVETASLIDGYQTGAGKMEMTSDTEFSDVYAAFAKILAHVVGLDTSKLFETELKEADDKAKSCEAMMVKDLSGAEATLNEAIATCKALAVKCSAAAGYGAQKQAADTLIAQASSANADKVIDAELDEAHTNLKAAENAAKAPEYDFVGAINLLGSAQASARKGLDTMQLYARTIKNARIKMTAAIAKYNEPSLAAFLGSQATRLQTVLDQTNADFDDRKLAQAEVNADKGIELAALHVDLCKACEKVVADLRFVHPSNAGKEAGHPITKDDEAEKKTLLDAMHEAIGKGSFKTAHNLLIQAYRVMMKARAKADAFDRFLPEELECEKKLGTLELRSVTEAGPGHEAVLALRKTFDLAREQKELENFTGARKRLDGFLIEVTLASKLLDQYDRYALRKTQAQKALDTVRKMKSPAIETLLTRLEGKDRNAERKGQVFDFAIATGLYEELKEECDNAKGTAEAVEDLGAMTSSIKVVADQDTGELKAAIAKANTTLDNLTAQPCFMYVAFDIKDARDRLNAAEKNVETDFDAARRGVEAVVDSCLAITLLLAQYDQLNDSVAVAQRLAETLLKREPEVGVARTQINERMAALEVAMAAARKSKSNRSQTQKDVEETISALRDLRRVVDAHKAYLANRMPIETTLSQLEKSKERHLIVEDMTEVRKLLGTAATRATGHEHASAEGELKKAVIRLDMAKLRAKLAKNTEPTPKDVKAILQAPDGVDNLDSIIETLEASVQRKVLAVAFEARFGCKLELQKPGAPLTPEQIAAGIEPEPVAEDAMDMPAPNLRRFYKEMAKLPVSNTLDNDSMLTFLAASGEQTGSAYDFGKKEILMREGDEATSHIYAIAVEHEIGELDPDAIPKEGEARTAFSWNTLHEVGHAVDDKLSYMKKHGERLAGWKVYGANVKEPATEIAQHFSFDADYVAEYMMSKAGRKLPVPEPVNCDAEVWHARMEESRMFVDRAREGNSPWASASVAAACGIGDYTYVESYSGDWARYRTDQRKYAVSGYQFRAPGEWFSELYAAKCADRLNSNHPHHDEIAQLCMKESP